MEKKNALSTIMIFSIISLIAFNVFVTWSNLGYVIDLQETIIEQQKLIIDLLEQKLQDLTGDSIKLNYEIHLDMYHYREGKLLAHSHHAATVTNVGKDWIEGKLASGGFANATTEATYIAVSNSTDSPSAAWIIIPSEITTGAMSRANSTYTSTGVGAWNQSHSFSPSETNSCRLSGLYWFSGTSRSLVASDTVTAINYQNGDTVTFTWSISVS